MAFTRSRRALSKQRAESRRCPGHDPVGDPGYVIGRVAGAVDDSLSRVDQFIVVQDKSPSGYQGAEKDAQVGNRLIVHPSGAANRISP